MCRQRTVHNSGCHQGAHSRGGSGGCLSAAYMGHPARRTDSRPLLDSIARVWAHRTCSSTRTGTGGTCQPSMQTTPRTGTPAHSCARVSWRPASKRWIDSRVTTELLHCNTVSPIPRLHIVFKAAGTSSFAAACGMCSQQAMTGKLLKGWASDGACMRSRHCSKAQEERTGTARSRS